MVLNKEIETILKQHRIDVSEGTLCLLAIYFKLDVNAVFTEETIKAINITKIVEKDFTKGGIIVWNIPLFEGQQTEWAWVIPWNNRWNVNMERKAGSKDVMKRMIEFFKQYPSYRVQDVERATDAYFKTVQSPQYLKSSDKFIFEGTGAIKKSPLAGWCEKTAGTTVASNMKGTIVK